MEKTRLVMKSNFWPTFYSIAFWSLFAFMVGCVVGNVYSKMVIDARLHDATIYKAVEIDGVRYSLTQVP